MKFKIDNTITAVFRVIKNYRNGFKVHHVVVTVNSDQDIQEEADFIVNDWAERDPSGQNNGYSLEWEEETDRKVIEEVLSDRKINITKEVERLNKQLDIFNKITLVNNNDDMVTISESCPGGYWYSQFKGVSFQIRDCRHSDLQGIQDGNLFNTEDCLVVVEPDYLGCIIDKKHINKLEK